MNINNNADLRFLGKIRKDVLSLVCPSAKDVVAAAPRQMPKARVHLHG